MRRRSASLKANLCQAQQRDLKTIASLLHRPIVLTDTIDYRTIGFLHYRPNPTKNVSLERLAGYAEWAAVIELDRVDTASQKNTCLANLHKKVIVSVAASEVHCGLTTAHTHNNRFQQQPFYGPLSRTTRVSRYQKKHSILIIIQSLSASFIYHDP